MYRFVITDSTMRNTKDEFAERTGSIIKEGYHGYNKSKRNFK